MVASPAAARVAANAMPLKILRVMSASGDGKEHLTVRDGKGFISTRNCFDFNRDNQREPIQCGKGHRRSFSLAVDHRRARPCGSAMRKNTISAPKTMDSTWEAAATESGKPNHCGSWFSTIGSRTMKRAPKNAPMIEPRPPMMTMKSSWNERSIEKAAGSQDPR